VVAHARAVCRESDEPVLEDATGAILAAAGSPPRASRLSGGRQGEWGSRALQDFANGVAEFFTDKPRPRPLYRYNTFGEADVISASGVGGGSLIYSNVTIEPFFDTTNKQYPAMASWPEKAKLLPADYANGLAWMTTNRGAPNQVVTKYPQAIPQNQLNTVKGSDPRLLGRSRFLRDASTSPNLSPQLAGQIVEPWAPLKLQIKEADPGNTATNKNFCERQGRCFLGCLPAARHTLNKTLLNKPAAFSRTRQSPHTGACECGIHRGHPGRRLHGALHGAR
jgi:hypothetical protein